MNQRRYSSFTIVLLAGLLASVVSVQAQQGNWNTTGSLSSARTRPTATLLANGKVLVVGGLNVSTPCCRTASRAELYDPATGQWSDAGSPDTPRTNHVAVRLANGKVLIAGGSTDLINSLSSAGLYDPSTNTWSSAGSLSIARQNAAAVLLPDGRVLITGGLPTNKAG